MGTHKDKRQWKHLCWPYSVFSVRVLWATSPCHWVSDSVLLKASWCLLLQDTQIAGPWRWRHCCPLKHHKPITQQCSITSQKGWILSHTTGKTSNMKQCCVLVIQGCTCHEHRILLLDVSMAVCIIQQHCQLAKSYSTGDKWNGMGHWHNDTDFKNKVLMENPIPVPQCPKQIEYRMSWDWMQASVARNSRKFNKTARHTFHQTHALFYILKMVPQDCFKLMHLFFYIYIEDNPLCC